MNESKLKILEVWWWGRRASLLFSYDGHFLQWEIRDKFGFVIVKRKSSFTQGATRLEHDSSRSPLLPPQIPPGFVQVCGKYDRIPVRGVESAAFLFSVFVPTFSTGSALFTDWVEAEFGGKSTEKWRDRGITPTVGGGSRGWWWWRLY